MTRTLNLLGASVPNWLIDPVADDNERGYWEPTAIVLLHDRILSAIGSAWDDVASLPEQWFATPEASRFADELADTLRAEYGDAPCIVVKDPRLCAVLPIWLRALPQLELTPDYVLPLRHPVEVARSLEKRSRFPLAKGLLIWLRNSLDAERYTRGARRVFTSYDELLADWPRTIDRIASTLDLEWPRPPALAADEVNAFLTSELRHQRGGSAAELLPYPLVQRAFEALQSLATGNVSATAELDAIHKAMEGAAGIHAEALTAIGRQLRNAEAEAARSSETYRSEIAAAAAEAERFRAESVAAQASAEQYRAESAAAQEQVEAYRVGAATAWTRAEAAESALARITRTRSWRLTGPLRKLARVIGLDEQSDLP